MSATPSVDDNFTFVGGLYTEGSFFLTPKNSWTQGDNVIPYVDGSVRKRTKLDFEQNFQQNTALNVQASDLNNNAFTVETWTSVGGNGNLDLFVVQQGHYIEFYKAFSGTVGASLISGATIDLREYSVFGNTNVIGTNVISTANCYGRLLVTSIDTQPLLVTYNTTTETISVQALEVAIRDFEGVRSPKNPWEELTPEQWQIEGFFTEAQYNLLNQGWKLADITNYASNNGGRYPANTKVWWYGKDTNGAFDPAVLNLQDFGTSLAPKGRFIINAFYQNRASAVLGGPPTDGPPPDITPGAPLDPGDPDGFGPIRPTDPNGFIP